ncbi:hypothetical protein [Floridanema aerugineum]|uniref:Uncharacterized protein n=1 Tax=Floridaenema aerugineum BLCC-F46 TaxID=3153654 RepID=A0ABV4X2A7_9CYAN
MQTTYLVNKEASQYCSVKHFLPLEGRSIRTKDLGFEYINCRPNASPLLLTEQYWEASKQPHLSIIFENNGHTSVAAPSTG